MFAASIVVCATAACGTGILDEDHDGGSGASDAGEDLDAELDDADPGDADAEAPLDVGYDQDAFPDVEDGIERTGLVTVAQSTVDYQGTPYDSYQINVEFFEREARDCTITPIGPCQFKACASGNPIGPPRAFQAGTVTISGGAFGSPIVLTPDGNNVYPVPMAQTLAFANGDTLRVQAVGNPDGGIPSFDQTIPVPSRARLDTTVFPGNGPRSRNVDIDANWTVIGNASGTIEISLLQTLAQGAIRHARCFFEAQASTGRISTEVLDDFAAGVVFVEVYAFTGETLSVNNFPVKVTATDFVFNGSLELQ